MCGMYKCLIIFIHSGAATTPLSRILRFNFASMVSSIYCMCYLRNALCLMQAKACSACCSLCRLYQTPLVARFTLFLSYPTM